MRRPFGEDSHPSGVRVDQRQRCVRRRRQAGVAVRDERATVGLESEKFDGMEGPERRGSTLAIAAPTKLVTTDGRWGSKRTRSMRTVGAGFTCRLGPS